MLIKRLVPVLAIAVMLALAAFATAGATKPQGVRIPPGAVVDSPNARAGVVDTGLPTIPAAPGLPDMPAKGVVYSDDFSANTISRYNSVDGTWKITSNRLQQLGDTDEGIGDAPSLLTANGVTFADNVVETQFYPTAMPAGVVFRGSNAGYYRFTVFAKAQGATIGAALEKVVGDTVTTVASVPASTYAGFTPNKWQTLKVAAIGSQITASIDGLQILSATDTQFTSGWTGVWAITDAHTTFDNLLVGPASATR